MKKRLNTLIGAVVLLLIINACSAPAPETTQADTTEAVTSSAETTQADTTPADTSPADTDAPDVTPDVVFETTDLDGNTVKSSELFAGVKLTMVNIWGTFCGPCINEMPELEVLNGRLQDKGCAIVGIVCDVSGPGDRTMADAEKIIARTGVTYLNVFPWPSFNKDLPAMYIPTTYFVDSNGMIVAEAAVGARDADAYEELVDSILKDLDER